MGALSLFDQEPEEVAETGVGQDEECFGQEGEAGVVIEEEQVAEKRGVAVSVSEERGLALSDVVTSLL